MANAQPRPENVSRKASLFPHTLWTLLLDPIRNRRPEADEALNRLCQTYIPPLRVYVQSWGHDVHRTEDLVHSFLENLIRLRAFEKADREKGLFRSFLLVSLKHFLCNHGRCSRDSSHVSIEAVPPDALATAEGKRPDVDYEKSWAWTVVNRAVSKVEKSYRDRGKEEVYRDLKGFLPGGEPGLTPNEVAAKWGSPVDTVHRAIHDFRHRVRQAMRELVACTVATSAGIDEELNYLMQVLSVP